MSLSPRFSPHLVSRSPCGVVAMNASQLRLLHQAADAYQAIVDREVVIPRTQSLEVATGDQASLHDLLDLIFDLSMQTNGCFQNGDLVEFTRDIHFTLRQFDSARAAMLESGSDKIVTAPIPLYLSHVLWSIAFKCRKVGDDAFKLSLVHIGPHLGRAKLERPEPDVNSPKGLETPAILAASLTLLSGPIKKERHQFDLTLSALEAPGTFSSSDLMRYAFTDPYTGHDVHIRIRLVIARSYFSLAKLIDLNPKPTVSIDCTVASILRGEKAILSDWVITVAETDQARNGQGDAASGPSCFHVHKETVARRSYVFKKLLDSGRSEHDFLLMHADCGGCKMDTFSADDMKVVIPLLYGTVVPLPVKLGSAYGLIKMLEHFFKADVLATDLYPHWERAICRMALAVDKTSDASMETAARLLTLIWFCPYGTMPVAKRVTIGVMADMMHLRGRKHPLHYQETWGREISLIMFLGGEEPKDALYLFHGKVVVVHKRLFSEVKPAAPAAAHDTGAADPDEAVTSAVAAAGDFVIELADGDEEWHDAETTDNQPEGGNKRGCVIC